jgi:acetyl-CoA C-acetyltransferase
MAGIKNPLEDMDLVELHDAFTISDLQTYGDIGLRPYGQEQDYIESGDAYYINPNTGKPGKCPSNLSGGLIGTMHAVGATGIFQAAECLWQVQQKYDKFHGDPKIWKKWGKEKPKDWQSLQIPKNSKQALWVSHAGVGSHVTVGILRKSW